MPNIFSRLTRWSIYLLVFLLPVFFMPFSFEAFEFNKQYLLLVLVLLGYIGWLGKMIFIDKEIRIKRTILDIPILGFIVFAILSVVFSVDAMSSIFGFYGKFSDGLMVLICFGLLYFLLVNQFNKANIVSVRGLIRTLLCSSFLVVLTSYFSLLGIWQKIIQAGVKLPVVMIQKTFNPIGNSIEGAAMFLTVILVMTAGLLIVNIPKKLKGIPLFVLLFSVLGLLVIIDYTPVWIIILITLVSFISFALWKRIFKQDVNRLILPILIIIIAMVFLISSPFKPVNNQDAQVPLSAANFIQEYKLDAGTGFEITKGAVTSSVKSAFIGTGIGTFHYDFAKFKPLEFNQNRFWQIRFDRPGNYILEIIATMGILGILAYFSIIVLLLLVLWLLVQTKLKIAEQQIAKKEKKPILTDDLSYIFPLAFAFIALLLAQFIYYQNIVLGFTFWLVLALLIIVLSSFSESKLKQQGIVREKVISLQKFPEMGLVFNIIFIVFVVAVFSIYFFTYRFYSADIAYAQAIKSSQLTSDQRVAELEKAVDLNPYEANYRIVLSRTYIAQALRVAADGEQAQAEVTKYISYALAFSKGGNIDYIAETGELKSKYIKGAVEISENRVANWEILAMIYRNIQGVAAGALNWAITSFEKASELEPTNPAFHIELGKLYLNKGETDKAKEAFTKALELKGDYVTALIQEALFYERDGELEEAIKKMESVYASFPENAEILFQMGRLYYNNNEADRAITFFEGSVVLMPNYSNAYYSLGVAYASKRDTDKALQSFRQVLQLNPGNQDVQDKIEELESGKFKTPEKLENEESEK
ncbi:tetratricopeptide repeat protein [Candidatus Parcubacteria bacterium]|nr:tetratricopeptide repeat protein [Candidatus Parcubacteria bacterium]